MFLIKFEGHYFVTINASLDDKCYFFLDRPINPRIINDTLMRYIDSVI